MTPPNSSSDDAPDGQDPSAARGAEQEAGVGLGALIARLAEEFGADTRTLAIVAGVFEEVRERAPDLSVPTVGTLAAALADRAALDAGNAVRVHTALAEWALDAEGEPIERMRRDCLRFQSAMTRGALRLQAAEPERCAESLLALQRFNFLQLALLASLSARSQEEGGVVRTLPTPEYATFMEIFRTTIETHQKEGKELGLLLLHVGKVDQVDRLLGMQRGEAFMLRVTRRLREGVLRRQDQLGRVSRDQLACLLPRIAGEGVAVLAANKILAVLEAPIPIGERSFPPDAVIGIAMFPDHGADQQTLVRNGKLAAAVARSGAERVAVYDPAHGESEERNMQFQARLRRALEESALGLAFVPQLDVNSSRIVGLECVLCWSDEALGVVSEARTLEVAEASGQVREATWWLFNNALRHCAEFSRAGLRLPLAVKLTASGLGQPDFTDFIDRALRTWGVPPEQLVIEIDESALSGDIGQVRETLAQLKRRGMRLGINGFGTGSCSLDNLAQLPLDEIRLAAAFVSDMREAPPHAKIVRSLVDLAHNLGLRVTAEGVDDSDTALALSTLDCERVQGAYVGRPLAAQEVLECGLGGPGPAVLPLEPGGAQAA